MKILSGKTISKGLDDSVEIWSQFGLSGLIIGALFFSLWLFIKALFKILNFQKQEREEWLKTISEISVRQQESSKECNNVVRDLTGVIKEMKGSVR